MDLHDIMPRFPVFKWWSWWSMWQDVKAISGHEGYHLMQCSRSRNGKVRFRLVLIDKK